MKIVKLSNAVIQQRGLFGAATPRKEYLQGVAIERPLVLPSQASIPMSADETQDIYRRRLLAAFKAGQLETLVVNPVVSNDQVNANNMRIMPESYDRYAASCMGNPYLYDHERGMAELQGYVTASTVEKDAAGVQWAVQSLEISRAAAIADVLEKRVRFFSTYWDPERVECSVCKADWEKCFHLPGQTVGKQTVVWNCYGSTGVETSAVVKPAVAGTGIRSVEAFAAERKGISEDEARRLIAERSTKSEKEMVMREKLLKLLGLETSATDEQIGTALDGIAADRTRVSRIALLAELPETATLAQIEDAFATKTTATVATLSAKVKELEGKLATGAAKSIVDAALAAGKISAAQVPYFEKRAAEDPEGTKALLAAKGTEVPVGVPAPAAVVTPPAGTLTAAEKATAAKLGVPEDQFLAARKELADEESRRTAAA